MKRVPFILIILLILIGSFLLGCSSSQVNYIKKNPDFLKPNLWARSFAEAWGPPDEVMAYQDFRNKQYSSFGVIGGSSDGFSGFSSSQSYTPTTVVWIYRNHNKALFFEQGDWLNIPRHALSTLVWKLVGWQNLTSDQTTKPQVTPPSSGTTTVVTVTWTSANIRTGAGDEFPVLMTVNRGERLAIIGERGEWFNVQLEDGKEGWINSRVVK